MKLITKKSNQKSEPKNQVQKVIARSPQKIATAYLSRRLFDFDGDGMISEDDLKSVIPDVPGPCF